MMEWHVSDLPEKQIYKYLSGTIVPRPIAWVSTRNEGGHVNLAPFSYFNLVSHKPPRLSLSILRHQGEAKDTARNILREGTAIIHLVDEDNVDLANQTALNLDPEESEADYFRIELEQAKTLEGLYRVKSAKVVFETRLVHHVPLQDAQGQTGTDFFILEVEHMSLDASIMDQTYIDYHALAPVARLAGQSYTKLGKIFELERPKKERD